MKKRSKRGIVLPALVALLCAMTFCVFGPLEIVLASPSEFWFQLIDILPTVGICFVGLFVSVFVSLFFLSYISEVFIALAFGLGLAMYIQGNFTFVSYGTMDGTPIDWSSFGSWPVINTLIWLLIVITVIVIFLQKKNLCKQAIVYICLGVVGMQILTLGTLMLTTEEKQKSTFYVSRENQLQMSEGHNILVVLADGFDGQVFSDIIENEEKLVECFDGFTFYPDTCGTSLWSEESGITLLTGNQFVVGPSFDENVKEAYANTLLYDLLKEHEYTVNIYAPENMVSPDIVQNVENIYQEELQISSIQECGNILYRMVAFRYAPHVLKSNFWYTTMEFADIAEGGSDHEKYHDSNIDFFNKIVNEGAVSEGTSNTYQFYWIQGPHEPVTMNRYCEPLDSVIQMYDNQYATAQYEQAVGVVYLMSELIDDLKEKELYNNTTIIFTADHGWNIRQNPLFMVKPAGSSGALQTSNAPLSMIEDYMPTLLYFVTGDKAYGDTIYEVEEQEKRERKIYVYDMDTNRTYTGIDEELYPAGVFLKDNVPLLKSELNANFTDNSCISILGAGWHTVESWGTWASNNASIRFGLEEPAELMIRIDYHTYSGSQDANIIYNGNYVGTLKKADAHVSSSVILPEMYCNKDGVQEVVFETINASAPYKDGVGADTRVLSIGVSKIVLSKTQYEMGTSVEITNTGNGVGYFVSGLSDPEEEHTWSLGHKTELVIPVKKSISADITAKINLQYVYAGSQSVTIRSGEEILFDGVVDSSQRTIEFVVPNECIQEGKLNLTFEYPDAASPAELGESEDSRVLAIAFSSMVFDEVK